ncbi:MAG: hypothetical protein C4288_17750 [Leptolyngbya sp. ERB_1_1]
MTTQLDMQSNSAIGTTSEAIDQEMIEARRLAAWERDRAQIEDFFNDPMKYISAFWQEYKPIVYVLGAILLASIVLKVVFGIIGFFTNLPIISGLLELVGIGYTIWFVSRYLVKAETRQELSQKVEEIKQDVVGAAQPVADDFKNAIEADQTLS